MPPSLSMDTPAARTIHGSDQPVTKARPQTHQPIHIIKEQTHQTATPHAPPTRFHRISVRSPLSSGDNHSRPEPRPLNTSKWWRRTGSNRRPPACKAGALPAELRPHQCMTSQTAQNAVHNGHAAELVGQGGLEPPTPRLSSVCSNQLSY